MTKINIFSLTLCILISSFASAQAINPSANEIVEEACLQATKENKHVFVIFYNSSCGWCKKMDQTMNDSACKKLFKDNYVICHLAVKEDSAKKYLENPGGDKLLTKYHGDKSGFPFWVILNKKGELVADSQIRPENADLNTPGENVGCPAAEKEIVHFQKVLKATSTLSDEQLSVILKKFSRKS